MSHPIRIKICGVTGAADARAAARLGADAVGLNFYEGSPRRIDPSEVANVLHELPPFVEAVGVFVNRPLCEIFAFIGPWRPAAHRPVARRRLRAGRRPAVPADPGVCGARCDQSGGGDAAPRRLPGCGRVAGGGAAGRPRRRSTRRYGTNRAVGDDRGVPAGRADHPGGRTDAGERGRGGAAWCGPTPWTWPAASRRSPGRKDADKMRRFIGAAREAAAKL